MRKYKVVKGEYKDQWWVAESYAEDRSPEDRAGFFGKGAREFARQHAKVLNALSEKDRP